ncbi:toxin-antitoxin system HicB family antitoxin [Xanthomonas campestris]|uniref:toxin-antitoxin system HicB family antitoxin n=1 Tax=Xanthomonas campestris TaxID=339 RepID=UPI00236756C4|nr:toxin-antitoxin system HicB family antitoxin [Xanthomonas campestris]WDJ00327.1 toxin-antitoxin system HicB family antitoxin [Xanthomonas campestris]
MSEDGYTRITLRIPDALHAKLTAEAARTSKSMNAEIVHRLEESFQAKPITVQSLIPVVSAAYRSALETQRALREQLRELTEEGPLPGNSNEAQMEINEVSILYSWFQRQASELQTVMAQLMLAHSSGEPIKLGVILQRLADVDVRVDV